MLLSTLEDVVCALLKHMGLERRKTQSDPLEEASFISQSSVGRIRQTPRTQAPPPQLHPTYYIFTIQLSHLYNKMIFFFNNKMLIFFVYNKMIAFLQYNKLLCYNKKIDCSTINPTHNNVPDLFFFNIKWQQHVSVRYLLDKAVHV